MKFTISQLQVIEVLLNRIYEVSYKKNDNPFSLVLNVDGCIVSGQMNYYDPKFHQYPLRYSVSGCSLDSYFANNDDEYRQEKCIDFEKYLKQICSKNYSKDQFESPETLLHDVIRILDAMESNPQDLSLKDAKPYGTLSFKNVVFIESGKTLPFLNLNDKEYELLSVLVSE